MKGLISQQGDDTSNEYLGKAVFYNDNGEQQFLGKFIKHENKKLTYLPPGLEDKPENYKTKILKNLYFKKKFLIKNIFNGPTRLSPENVVDADEYFKSLGNLNSVAPSPESKQDEDEIDGGKKNKQTKRRKQTRKTSKRRKHKSRK